MSSEMVKHGGGGDWSEEQKAIVRNSLANGASDSEFAVLWEMARSRGLNPIKKEIYFVKRWDSNKRAEVWATQVSIDGLRVIAARSGEYDGQDEPEFEYDDKGNLKLCRVKVYRKGVRRSLASRTGPSSRSTPRRGSSRRCGRRRATLCCRRRRKRRLSGRRSPTK